MKEEKRQTNEKLANRKASLWIWLKIMCERSEVNLCIFVSKKEWNEWRAEWLKLIEFVDNDYKLHCDLHNVMRRRKGKTNEGIENVSLWFRKKGKWREIKIAE